MTYRIHYTGSEGIPLDSVLDDEDQVVCIPPGGMFSKEGLGRIRCPMHRYEANFEGEDECGDVPSVHIQAYDLEAALVYLRHAYIGEFRLWVTPNLVFLGAFIAKGRRHGAI